MIERSTTRTRNRRTLCDRKDPTGSPAFRFPINIGFLFVFVFVFVLGVVFGVGVAATPWVEALVVRPQSHRTSSSPGLRLHYLSHTQIPVPPVAVADDPRCKTTAAATARFQTTPKAMLLAMLAWTLAATPVSASAPAFAVATGVPEDNNPAPAQLHLAEKVSTTRGGHGNGNGNRDVHAPSSLLLLSSPLSPSPLSSLSLSSLSLSLESLSSSPYTGTPYTGELMDVSRTSLVALESGVTYRDLRAGTGTDAVTEGNRVNIQWVLKRSNGYTIDASANHDGVPFIFVVGGGGTSSSSSNNSNSNNNNNNNNNDGERGGSGNASANARAIAGLDEGIRGMTIGGIRRIVIPPSLAYVDGLNENDPGPVPPGFGPKQRIRRVMENRIDVPDESFLLDVKLTRIQ